MHQQLDSQEIISRWHRGMRILELGHHTAAAHFTRRQRLLGIPVVIVSTVVGTTVFATISSSPHPAAQILVGILSVTAGILSSLQTFLNFPELAEKHKIAAVKYGGLRREIEQVGTFASSGSDQLQTFFESFRTRWDALDEDSPSIPMSIYRQTVAIVEAEKARQGELK